MNRIICLLSLAFLISLAQSAEAATTTLNIYSHESDGNINLSDSESIALWSIARGYSGSLGHAIDLTQSNIAVRSDKNSGNYRIYRSSLSFDTSIIPDEAKIESAALKLYKWPGGNNTGELLHITSHNKASAIAYTALDWPISNFGTVSFASNVLADAEYTTYDLNSNGVNYLNKSDWTTFGVLTDNDFNDVDPGTVIQSGSFYSANAVGVDTDPYLEITYTLPEEQTLASLVAELNAYVANAGFKKPVLKAYQAQLKKIKVEEGEDTLSLSEIKALLNFKKQIYKDKNKSKITEQQYTDMNNTVLDIWVLLSN